MGNMSKYIFTTETRLWGTRALGKRGLEASSRPSTARYGLNSTTPKMFRRSFCPEARVVCRPNCRPTNGRGCSANSLGSKRPSLASSGTASRLADSIKTATFIGRTMKRIFVYSCTDTASLTKWHFITRGRLRNFLDDKSRGSNHLGDRKESLRNSFYGLLNKDSENADGNGGLVIIYDTLTGRTLFFSL